MKSTALLAAVLLFNTIAYQPSYPHLERVAGKDEVLTRIAAPRVQ